MTDLIRPAAGPLIPTPMTMSRSTLLDAIADAGRGHPIRLATMAAEIVGAHSTATLVRLPQRTSTAFWIGDDHTIVVEGEDPVTVHRIRSANAVLAIAAATRLRVRRRPAFATGPPRRTDPPHPGPTGSWWRLRIRGSVDHDLEVMERPPGGVYTVIDRAGVTSLRPTTIVAVVDELCDVMARVVPAI